MYNRESRIMRKLLGKPANDPSAGDATATSTSTATPTSYRPIKSQNAVHPVTAPVSCLDVSADGRAAVLGGPHILKTLVLDTVGSPSFSFSDGVDIRASITSQKTSGSKANIVADQLNIRDVKWHENGIVFTACATGRIFGYDPLRIDTGGSDPLECFQMQEDSRQINTLDVNPHLKSWLLAGSQDGIARVFDVSAPTATRSGMPTFRQRFSPLKNNESIRKVMWSPRVGHEMACCTEGGVVLKWDVRQPSRPVLRINAHENSCTTMAWHPDGIHLISAGWDSKLHVWDLGASGDKRQKPKWTITTPAPVSSLAWRPGLWSATAQTRRVAQVAVSYDESSNRRYGASVVHIWDLARPTMPYKEIERFDSSPSAMLWRDQDMLWTVGQDGIFNQCDVAYAPKSIDRLSTSAMAFSPQGDVVMFLDERAQQSRPRPIMHHSETPSRPTYSSSPNVYLLGGSKSDSEEDVLGTFIGTRRKLAHRRRLSGRSGQPMSTTPPSGTGFADEGKGTLGLDMSIGVTGMFRSPQVMASGRIPASTKVPVYQYLTASYLEILERVLPKLDDKVSLAQRVGTALEEFSRVSENVRLYRLSQSWRVIAFAMHLLLKKRADYHLDARSSRFQKRQLESSKPATTFKPPEIYGTSYNGEETPRRPTSAHGGSIDGRLHAVRSLLSEEIESTSNVPTPIARPVDAALSRELETGHYQHGKKLTPIIEPESFNLGPSMHTFKNAAHSPGSSQAISDNSRESEISETSITEGYDFYDAEALSRAIDVPEPKTKEAADRQQSRIKPARHDSEDSMGEIFSISAGAKQNSSVEIAGAINSDVGYSSKISSGSADTQFEPRIHGDVQRRKSNVADSPEDVFMISQTTASTDDVYPSQISFASQSDSDHNPSFQQSTAPAEAVDGQLNGASSHIATYYNDPRPHIIESDYFPWPEDPDFLKMKGDSTVPAALDPYLLLKRAFDFECRSSAVNAAAMVLLLRPLLPDGIIDTHLARGILRQHHERLMRMRLFVEASALRKLCIQGWPEGMPEWGENYTPIFSPAQQGVKTGLLCSACRKPREVDPSGGRDAIWTCERCRAVMAPCAVCNHRDAELPAHIPGHDSLDAEDAGLNPSWVSNWWWFCPGCAHGGHASCLQIWHGALEADDPNSQPAKFSGGCCPLDGCGHACLPGRYRGEVVTARADELGRATLDSTRVARDEIRGGGGAAGSRRSSPGGRGGDRSVRSDSYDIPQSKAVGMAREALNKGGSSPSSGGGILSSSPGRVPGTGERERRKSVKFVKTER
ncbi:WD repeat protein [Cordyceps fumosorosea ARSEF 2679]|uniref:WD repeat protein n=1 Tax=Cordyceps fumosorosea (strain ARSEF 2679) TaxID=1081104 RepID=A0A162J172_CORFA|nr:WD repeat protein [Cordyceps fumosorosea ARSEF 2679]OAA62292.1 WD repeat protein [Cordyceps fumosorosea ARSEF 2679]